jgi:hypothetical protein
MKTSIKLTALLLLASVSVFAASPAKAKIEGPTGVITFSTMPSLKGVEIKVDGNTATKAIVLVYDQDKNVIFKDVTPAYKAMEKGYILNQLEEGDYTLEVTANHQTVTKQVHVYDEDGTREFIVQQ